MAARVQTNIRKSRVPILGTLQNSTPTFTGTTFNTHTKKQSGKIYHSAKTAHLLLPVLPLTHTKEQKAQNELFANTAVNTVKIRL